MECHVNMLMVKGSRLRTATKQLKMLAFAGVLFVLSWGATCQGQTDEDPAFLHPKVHQSSACMVPNTAELSTPSSTFEGLPGFTRSVYERDHALITPESQVWGSLLGWTNSVGAILVTPAMGAHFTMYLAKMKGNSVSGPPQLGVERFLFVLSGSAQIKIVSLSANNAHNATAKLVEMQENMFAYIPPGVDSALHSTSGADLVIFERKHAFREAGDDDTPLVAKVGKTDDEPTLDTPGEIFTLRKLLPQTPAYDFNIHIMDFQPGEYLNVKEVHYNQHGLLMLEGKGIYRLSNKWYPVQAGDAIWMAPFVPQWYAALGKTRTRYLLYKDVNRDPLLHV